MVRNERTARAGHEAAGRSDPARGVASPGGSPAGAVSARCPEARTKMTRRLAAISTPGRVRPGPRPRAVEDGEFPDRGSHLSDHPIEIGVHPRREGPGVGRRHGRVDPRRPGKPGPSRASPRPFPASERGRKRALLERATTLLRQRSKRAIVSARLQFLYGARRAMAGHGRTRSCAARARRGKIDLRFALFLRLRSYDRSFLGQLARLEPDQALARLQKLPTLKVSLGTLDPHDPPAAVAVELAIDHPAEAERAFHLRQRTGVQSSYA